MSSLSLNYFRHRITIFNAVIGKGASVVGTCLEPCACDVQAQRIKCGHLTPVPYRRSRAHSSRHDHAPLAGSSGTRTGCLLVEAPSTWCRWRPLPGPGGSNPPPFVSEHIFTVFTRRPLRGLLKCGWVSSLPTNLSSFRSDGKAMKTI